MEQKIANRAGKPGRQLGRADGIPFYIYIIQVYRAKSGSMFHWMWGMYYVIIHRLPLLP
jgi:hypothetical protein